MFLFDGPAESELAILLAHGAGAPMDSASLNAIANALAITGLRVARFEFRYMARRVVETYPSYLAFEFQIDRRSARSINASQGVLQTPCLA